MKKLTTILFLLFLAELAIVLFVTPGYLKGGLPEDGDSDRTEKVEKGGSSSTKGGKIAGTAKDPSSTKTKDLGSGDIDTPSDAPAPARNADLKTDPFKGDSQPLPFEKDCGIKISSSDRNVPAKNATVSADKPTVSLGEGIQVSFHPGTLDSLDRKLSAKSLGRKKGGDTEAYIYEFSLEGKDSFPLGVELTLPYDPSWGDDVYAMYYNERTSSWEYIYSEVLSGGKGVIHTTHFTPFGFFFGGGGSSDIVSFDANPKHGSPLRTCSLNVPAFNKAMNRMDKGDVFKGLTNDPNPSSLTKNIDQIGLLSGVGEHGAKVGEILFDSGAFGSINTNLGYFGSALTILKLSIGHHKSKDLSSFLSDNSLDITSLAVSALGTALPSVAAFCNVAGLAIFAYGAVSSTIDNISKLGTENATEYAYVRFSTKYLTWKWTRKGIDVSHYYDSNWVRYNNNMPADVNLLYQTSLNNFADMVSPLMLIQKNYTYANVPKAVENFYTQLAQEYWIMAASNPTLLDSYLGAEKYGLLGLSPLKKDYTAPSPAERQKYITRYKSNLYAWTKPHLDDLVKSSFDNLARQSLQSANKVKDELNRKITFTVNGPFMESVLAAKHSEFKVTLSLAAKGEAVWEFEMRPKDKCAYFECTKCSFLEMGSPRYIQLRRNGEVEKSIQISLSSDRITAQFENNDGAAKRTFQKNWEGITIKIQDGKISINGGTPIPFFYDDVTGVLTLTDGSGTLRVENPLNAGGTLYVVRGGTVNEYHIPSDDPFAVNATGTAKVTVGGKRNN